MATIEFILWKNNTGRCYVGDFIEEQGGKIAFEILTLLEDLQRYDFDILLRNEKIKKITKDIYEIRLNVHSDKYRFLFGIHNSSGHIVEAFKKKTQKTPLKYIKNAEDRMFIVYQIK